VVQTKAGAAKAKKTHIENLGSYEAYVEHRRRIGHKGGSVKGTKGGFAAYRPCECKLVYGKHHKAQCAGARGGMISRKGKKNAENS